MKKLLGLLAATGLVATTGATVVACGDPAGVAELAKVELTAAKLEGTVEVEVSAFVADKELDITSDKGEKSILTIEKTAVVEATKKSTVTISVAELPKEAANEVLTVKYNDVVLGEIKVSIAKSEEAATAVALSTVVTDGNLENVPVANVDEPTTAEVLAAVKAKFEDLDTKEVAVTLGETDGTATISANDGSKVYTGSVELTFTPVLASK